MFRGVRLYLGLHLTYAVFLLLCAYMEWGNNNLHDTFLFYFYAPYTDFKLWFPQYHLIVYLFFFGIKLSLVGGVFGGVRYLYKQYNRIRPSFLYNSESGYVPFLKREGEIAMIFLLFYLLLYYASKFLLNANLHSDIQVLIARGFLLHVLIQLLTITVVHYQRVKDYLKNYLLEPQLPYNIAVLRILFFTYLIYLYGAHIMAYLPTVSLATKETLPYIGWLIDIIPVNADLYTVFVGIGVACCCFIIVGFQTRWFLILNAICVFYIVATPNFFGKLWHHQIVIWISWFFAFSRCYDVFSIDAWRNKTAVVKSADYTFPVRFVWLSFGIIYFWAGFYKLWDCGFDWALSKSMVNQVQLEWAQNYDKVPAMRIDRFPVFLYIAGVLTILFELCYPFFVLKTNLRWLAIAGGLLMHNIIGYFMYISFSHYLQAFYVSYIDFGKWFAPKNVKPVINKHYSKLVFGFGIFILCANFLCGMFSIDSYPFSAYPKYAAIIPDSLKIIHFEARMADGTAIDVHAVGKKNGFRWESYGWLEYNLIKDYENGIDISARLKDYWQIWANHNPELQECKTVQISITERPVAPEGANNIKTRNYVGFLEF